MNLNNLSKCMLSFLAKVN